jgi:hypothetical protein
VLIVNEDNFETLDSVNNGEQNVQAQPVPQETNVPEEVNNATVIYNSHIFGQIKVLIPNKGIIFIDINLDLY